MVRYKQNYNMVFSLFEIYDNGTFLIFCSTVQQVKNITPYVVNSIRMFARPSLAVDSANSNSKEMVHCLFSLMSYLIQLGTNHYFTIIHILTLL